MQRLFISYRTLNFDKVDAIVTPLRALKLPDGNPRFHIWQDRDKENGIRPGQDWWEAIVDAIIACDVFVFMMSADSVNSINCQAELHYARKRNRPVLPIVLRDEFIYDPIKGNYSLAYWENVPPLLDEFRTQFLFDKGASTINEVVVACEAFARQPQSWRDIEAPRPADPRPTSEASNHSITLYDEACDYAWREQFDIAERLFQKLVNRNDPHFSEDAHGWIVILRAYQQLVTFDNLKSTRHKVAPLWTAYQQQFPKPFIEGIFDPKGFHGRFGGISAVGTPSVGASAAPIPTTPAIVREATPPPEPAAGTRMTDAHGIPMVYVPAGKFLMGSPAGEGFDDERPQHEQIIRAGFWLDLTPVTNQAYARFVEAGGYQKADYWTRAGWKWLRAKKVTGPADDNNFTAPQQPRVGVSWFEAWAYAQWRDGRLPTEAEWEWAARGPENRAYPWGNAFDASVVIYDKNSGGKTAAVGEAVRQSGASWVGVLDLSGNVWEWCSSLYQPYPFDAQDGREDSLDGSNRRALRGGSWHVAQIYARAAYRNSSSPDYRYGTLGFRVASAVGSGVPPSL
ncbi:MAG: SUMF1/EgtB/PvdO family nonheme iron enzyme [Anaerolineae bacterium]|nr:SUMF1/EgtB/PvdO family nonheme iron enzyme [Anaerolineae bacterium]